MSDIRLLSSKPLFSSSRFALAQEEFATPDGTVSRALIHHPGAIAIIAQPRPDTLLLVRQFRYSVRRWTLEIPAGTCEPGEDPRQTAARELTEEAGYAAATLSEIMRFHPAIGVSDEVEIVYRAEGLTLAHGERDQGELISGEVAALADLPRLAAEGMICDAKTLLAMAILGVPLIAVTGVRQC